MSRKKFVAVLVVIGLVVLILIAYGLHSSSLRANLASCGDGQCEGHENSYNCFADCGMGKSEVMDLESEPSYEEQDPALDMHIDGSISDDYTY